MWTITGLNRSFQSCPQHTQISSTSVTVWPEEARRRKGEFIPNPCDHVMFEHLQYRFSRVETKSAAGKIANEYLDFNDEESVQFREFVLRTIARLEEDRREHQEAIRAIEQRAKSNPENIAQLEQARADTERALEEIERDLARVTGASPSHR